MHFTTTQHHLNHGLSIVGHALSGKPTRPIEAYVLAQTTADRQTVRLSARREDMGIHCWIPASGIEQNDVALLPAKMVSDFVGNLPPSPVIVTVPSLTDPLSCHLQCARIKANMKNAAEDPAEIPAIPSSADGGQTILHLDTELLKQIITEVSFAAADTEGMRPGLIGVHIDIENGQATFAAADSFRLAVRRILIPDDQLRQTLLLPAKTMEDLAKMLPYEGIVQVLLTEDHKQVVFHTSTVDVSTRLLTMPFPNITGALSHEWATRAIIQTQELASLVRLMTPFARQAKNYIRLKLYAVEATESFSFEREPNTVKLEVVAQDVGENENVITAQVEGHDQEIDLHVKHLADVLSVISTPQIALEITNKQRPAVIRPVGGDDYTYVMMPVNFGHEQAPSPRAEFIPSVAAR